MKTNRDLFLRREAEMFYSQFRRAGKLTAVYNDIVNFYKDIERPTYFQQHMVQASWSNEDKQHYVDQLFLAATPETREFVQALIDESSFTWVLPGIQAFVDIYRASSIEIVTAIELSEDEVMRIKRAFEEKSGQRFDTVTTEIDPSVIGGVRVKSQSFMLDGTIQRRLEEFKSSTNRQQTKR